MPEVNAPPDWQILLILTGGIVAVSAAAVLIRLATSSAGTSSAGFSLAIAALRLTVAAIVLLPTWRVMRQSPPTHSALLYATAAGIALAIHFATWITSLSYTSIAASTTIVTTNPIWVTLFSWRWLGEKPRRLTLLGIGIALLGGSLIGLAGGHAHESGPNPLLGDGLALIGALAASAYLLLGREAQRQGLRIAVYVTVAYSVAAIVLLPLPVMVGTPYQGYPFVTYGYIALMALVSQIIGHTTLNWAVRWISPLLVALVNLLEPILASVWGYLLFAELPGLQVVIGAIVLLVGVGVASVAASGRQPHYEKP